MTGRTHDLAAFTALVYVVTTQTLSHITLATGMVSLSANLIGGLAPDIDQPTAYLWNRFPAGSIIGKIVAPFLGGHRFLSHSLLGVFIFGVFIKWLLTMMSHVLLVDMNIVWWAFMIGYLSHLIMDTFTREGVPWLFPIPVHFGIPPLRILRIKTGGLLEKSFIFPTLLLCNVYIIYIHYGKLLDFFHHHLK